MGLNFRNKMSKILGTSVVDLNDEVKLTEEDMQEVEELFNSMTLGDYLFGLYTTIPRELKNMPVMEALEKMTQITPEELEAMIRKEETEDEVEDIPDGDDN